MSSEKSAKKKSPVLGWVAFGLVALVFVGARQLHPGGIRGLLGDFITHEQSNPEIQVLHDTMLVSLKPMGAAAICLKEHSDDANLKNALERYNSRNEGAMIKLIASIEAAGGMSKSEKDLLDRQAFREARSFVGQGVNMESTCGGLAERFNSGEFDLN
jgi:hypothetical protein